MKTFLTFVSTFSFILVLNAQNLELPFYDDFSNEFTNWTTYSVTGDDQWHISGDDGIDGGKCARFYLTSNPPQANDDWLVSKVFNTEGISNIAITFKYLFFENGVSPDFYYTNSFDGNPANSTWTQIDKSFWLNNPGWQNARIEIENPGETFVFALRYHVSASDSYYFLMDNFRIESFEPLTFLFSDSTSYFKFYTTLDNGEDYWNEISEDVDNWYQELCSYWDRTGTNPLFNADKKTAIYLLAPENFAEYSEVELPAWKCGYSQSTNTIITKLSSGENSIYNSYATLVKNTLAQYILKKQFNGNCEDYFSEGFGLFYTDYQPNRDSILLVLNTFGHRPAIEQLKNINLFGTTYQKDLITSYVESQVLSIAGIQAMGVGAYLDQWYSHLEYYYNMPENRRIKLLRRTEKFNIYGADSDIPHLDAISKTLEDQLKNYEKIFDFPINHRIYCVVYPTVQARCDCLIVSCGNGGSSWSGDKLDFTSKNEGWGDSGYYGLLIPHELVHTFQFNLLKFSWDYPGIYIEGLANYMPLHIRPDYLNGTEQNVNKIANAFNHYHFNYKIEPNFENIMDQVADENFDGYYNDPYYFGELFYKYFLENEGDYTDLRTFFLNNLDYNAIGKTYDEIDKGYMTFIKEYAGLNSSIDTLELPFTDNFQDRFKNWSYVNVEGFDNYWKINTDDGFNQSNCAQISGNILNEDWLISDIFNTNGYHNLVINFKYNFSGAIPEIYYASDFNGDISNSTWEKIENVFTGNQNVWNNATIQIEDPGNSMVIGIKYKSANNNFANLSIDNIAIDGIYTGTKTLQLTNYDFKVYPNPATSESIISFQTKNSDNINLSLFDLQGRKISTLIDENLNAGVHTISLGNQIKNNGVYLLRLATSEGVSTLKLVVSK